MKCFRNIYMARVYKNLLRDSENLQERHTFYVTFYVFTNLLRFITLFLLSLFASISKVLIPELSITFTTCTSR